ncbi:hypothetical protein A3F19_03440 [Candidatus Nomurabacteria bacterium RIFCSPHIGHO2_12_FULL_37_29]|uniref:Uncharacterized protein n=2 Tax=Candidatus Nomuraibacteriota TaxID=1752729 RepID=A0A1F6Y707_9BACT|nr:MAG: hypothetical protein A2727_02525 [Candidatus Nomurabacteria bacterium RIFCSPHIGHO2_01_FULL_37_110]OGI79507.1 MAG: hypothetical protein A3F19_03440 [Candidatus Nomurabacteria bacterium RIFCSPHIGHO2_12_FULL_37_29]OGI85394.1 MAG: hypothetical protein A3A92_01680 [Candidatus Nomurabacteria bacterium RIFCSPLOWO2_01_FULL_37_49]OGJ02151.1 MAG: hypothetical protein A3G98_01530 [Candidatus Nomurabacteria bacterium RIFCSPLOWO2_12_FULL_37_8]
MRENFPITERQSKIKVRAHSDAFDYVQLMRRKSPKSLEPGEDGRLIINAVEGESILEKARADLNLNVVEIMLYLENLATAVENLTKN